jgi:xanthine dehydrogenase accessory factor
MDVYDAVEEYLARGQKGTLATIVKKIGAAPREEGAKMFIGEDGRFFGTVGGGCVEAEVWQEAKRVMKTEKAKILHYRMDGKLVEDEGMICGGNIDVFLEPVSERYRNLYREVKDLEKLGKTSIVVTEFSEEGFKKSLLKDDGTLTGDDPGDTMALYRKEHMNATKPRMIGNVLVEPVVSTSVLYVFGAGHISQYLSQIAAMVDFNVVIIDDRADFANRERFPEAQEIIVEDFSNVFEQLTFQGKEYVAILTRGHKHDATVLEEALKRPTRYVGMIGSTRKTKMVLKHLREKGFDEASLKSVHAPIGLDIDAETPQEIAVAIMAELISIKRRG